jgi:cystathionine beta-lyase/cystathionine gamma-synthase
MTREQAVQAQFALVDAISHHFSGTEFLSSGDYGVTPGRGRPNQTMKVEKVLAEFFGTEDCVLVRGAGTGGIRLALSACLNPGDPIMLHKAPIYTTTKETIRLMGLKPVFVDYHDLAEVVRALSQVKVVYVQHSRQQMRDEYDVGQLIQAVKRAHPDIPVLVDDNYTVFKVPHIGVQLGADISTFSGFKLLGPEGIGIVVGKQAPLEMIKKRNYSGGGQVQGPEAMELLRALVTAPVMCAIQTEQAAEICSRLNDGEVPGIEWAQLSNSQSRNVIAKLSDPIAQPVIEACDQFGGAIFPVGAESKYEVLPMIYRVSGSFVESDPELAPYLLRINPMRSGAGLVIDILKKSLHQVNRS